VRENENERRVRRERERERGKESERRERRFIPQDQLHYSKCTAWPQKLCTQEQNLGRLNFWGGRTILVLKKV
jgi:hypothetical protein